jgi:thiol-disulfide isomerase/thioredoxin
MRLPPGKYRLEGKGGQTYTATRDFEIEAGQRELSLELDLPATRLAHLIGQPAPELRQIKGWKNGGPVTLKELQGKCILLDFWGYWCGPCVAGMPSLMKLHDVYSKHGLVIIAVHDDSVASVSELDERLAAIRERLWGGRDLPFLVALDGGGKIELEGASVKANGATTAAYDIRSFPRSILIDPDGKVVRVFEAGSPEAVQELEKLLKIDRGVVRAAEDRDWRGRFDRIYCLGTNEVLKRIRPPFIPERLAYYQSEHPTQASYIAEAPESFFFLWDKGLERALWRSSVPTLREIVTRVAQLPQYELDGMPEVFNKELPGDWIARKNARPEEVLKALEQAVLREFNPPVRFERKRVEQEVLVARGRFQFTPLPGSYDDDWIHVYSDALDAKGTSGGGSGDFETFLRELGETALGMQVLNHVEAPPKGILAWGWHGSGIIRNLKVAGEKDRKLHLLIENLTRQTGLQFEVRRESVEIWYAAGGQDRGGKVRFEASGGGQIAVCCGRPVTFPQNSVVEGIEELCLWRLYIKKECGYTSSCWLLEARSWSCPA